MKSIARLFIIAFSSNVAVNGTNIWMQSLAGAGLIICGVSLGREAASRVYKKEIECINGEMELLKHNYNTVSTKYFELVNSDEYKELVGRK